MKTLIYCRVSTREQGASGLGLEAQRETCLAEVTRRGWSLAATNDRRSGVVIEVASAGRQRPKLEEAMRMLDSGLADTLMVSRLDRLSRSTLDFAKIIDRAVSKDWGIVVLSPALDLSAATGPAGRMLADVLMAVAQYERALASARTKEGLAALKEKRGGRTWGVKPYGDRVQIRRIVRLREQGMSKVAIAQFLTEGGVTSPNGLDHWNHWTVGRILEREGMK